MTASFSTSISAATIFAGGYYIENISNVSSDDTFAYFEAPDFHSALTDTSKDSGVNVPSGSSPAEMTMNMEFTGDTTNNLAFIFEGGGENNSITINGTLFGHGSLFGDSNVLYTDETEEFVHLTTAGLALSAIFVDLKDLGVSSLTNFNVTLGEGVFLTAAGALTSPVPLPAAAWLFLSGLGMFGWFARCK